MSDEHKDKAIWPEIEPIAAGLKGRCPRCGEGRLFSSFLTVGKSCGVCGLDYSFADAGDGPAVFVILIIGFVVVGLALWMEVTLNPPLSSPPTMIGSFSINAQMYLNPTGVSWTVTPSRRATAST